MWFSIVRHVRLTWHYHLGLMLGLPLLLLVVIFGVFATQSKAAPTAPAAPLAPGSITGQVRNTTDMPLSDIQVWLYRTYTNNQSPHIIRRTTTAEDGSYQFTTLSPGVYVVEFVDPLGRYAFQFYANATIFEQATPLHVAGNDLSAINAQLIPAGMITGILTATNDLRLSSAYMIPYRKEDENKWQETSIVRVDVPTNTFAIRGLASGTYRLCAVGWMVEQGDYIECFDNISPQATDLSGNLRPNAGIANATDIQVTSGLTTAGIVMEIGDIVFEPQMSGIVRNALGIPLPQIIVRATQVGDPQSAETNTTITNQQGRYRLRLHTPGSYEVQFTDSTGAYAPAMYQSMEDTVPTPVALEYFALNQGINMTLTAAARITGTVLIYGETPPTDGSVTILPHDGIEHLVSVAIDPITGIYDAGGLTTGAYRVMAGGSLGFDTFTGFYGGSTLDSASTISITTGDRRSNIDITLGGNDFDGEISGTVMVNNRPIEDIRVELYWSDTNPNNPLPIYHTFTDTDGRYRIAGLRAGYHLIRFSDPAGIYATTYYTNAVQQESAQSLKIEGQTKFSDVHAKLERGGTIQGRVTRADGRPVGRTTVIAYTNVDGLWRGKWNEWVASDNNGQYRLQGLHPGTYLVEFSDSTSSSREFYGGQGTLETATRITVTAGLTTTGIDLILGPDTWLYLPVIHR